MNNNIIEFYYAFKNKTVEADEIVKYRDEINSFAQEIKQSEYFSEIESNFLLILGYTYRLEDLKQKLFYTFSEAVYALDLARLTRDEEGLKLNSAVYSLVLEICLNEYCDGNIDNDLKQKAILEHKEMEEKKAKEASKYHKYQY